MAFLCRNRFIFIGFAISNPEIRQIVKHTDPKKPLSHFLIVQASLAGSDPPQKLIIMKANCLFTNLSLLIP